MCSEFHRYFLLVLSSIESLQALLRVLAGDCRYGWSSSQIETSADSEKHCLKNSNFITELIC